MENLDIHGPVVDADRRGQVGDIVGAQLDLDHVLAVTEPADPLIADPGRLGARAAKEGLVSVGPRIQLLAVRQRPDEAGSETDAGAAGGAGGEAHLYAPPLAGWHLHGGDGALQADEALARGLEQFVAGRDDALDGRAAVDLYDFGLQGAGRRSGHRRREQA